MPNKSSEVKGIVTEYQACKWIGKLLLILLLIVLALLFVIFPKVLSSPERLVKDVRSGYIESQYPSWIYNRVKPIPCPTPTRHH